jgi:uncharacterized membrane protein
MSGNDPGPDPGDGSKEPIQPARLAIRAGFDPHPGEKIPANDPQLLAYLYSGPIPPPEVLRQLEKIVPGSAKQIVENSLSQTRHRQSLEMMTIKAGILHERIGVIVGGTVVLTAIIMGGLAAIAGNPVGAAFVAVGPLVGVATIFVYGTDSRRKERESKAKLQKQAVTGEARR